MDKSLLKSAYSPDYFREQGHQLIDLLADHLETTLNERSSKVIQWNTPNKEYKYWKDFLLEGDEEQLYSEILKHTIHVHHPKYMGHQISPIIPITGLTSLMSALLNNGMGIYEMGSAPTAMERIVMEILCKTVGYPEQANGFLTSGGTLANLTALLSARKSKVKHNVWEEGNQNKLAIMVSEAAHYCIDRAARIMGLGAEGIIKIPVDDNFALNTLLLDEYYQQAITDGFEVFAIVGSAPSTATGIYDDLEAISAFASTKGIWFHVDAAHGGGAIFSDKYRVLLRGVAASDSIVIDGHKMMMMPAITTALLFKDGQNSHNTFQQKADYLLQESVEEDWYNLAKRTFECTKYMMSLHWYAILKMYGGAIFNEFVTNLYDLGHQWGGIIKKEPNFELAVDPMSNIVCFRFIATSITMARENAINEKIRQQLLEEGEFYIVETKLNGIHYLRTTLMNPFTTENHLLSLLETIRKKANLILSQT